MVTNMVHGGKLALLGILPSEAWLEWPKVIFNSLTLQGIYGRQMFETWYKMTAMLESGLDVSPVLTHRFPMNDYEEAFEVMRKGHCGKVLLDWS
jgi:threonine 3-dehydrogenase